LRARLLQLYPRRRTYEARMIRVTEPETLRLYGWCDPLPSYVEATELLWWDWMLRKERSHELRAPSDVLKSRRQAGSGRLPSAPGLHDEWSIRLYGVEQVNRVGTIVEVQAFEPTHDGWIKFIISGEGDDRTFVKRGLVVIEWTPPAIKPSSDAELLKRLGTNGELWAQAFCERHGGDLDVVLGWFANAIEAGRSAGWTAGCEQERKRWADVLATSRAKGVA
jgi:hypothetical protein